MASKPEVDVTSEPKEYISSPWREWSSERKVKTVGTLVFLFGVGFMTVLNMHGDLEMFLTVLFYWLGKLGMFVKGLF